MCSEDPDSGERTVILPKGYSTSLRLHEMGHQRSDRNIETLGDVFDEELDAESFSFENRSKELSWKIARPAICRLIADYGIRNSNGLFSLTVDKLRSRGLVLSKKSRSELWWYIRAHTGK